MMGQPSMIESLRPPTRFRYVSFYSLSSQNLHFAVIWGGMDGGGGALNIVLFVFCGSRDFLAIEDVSYCADDVWQERKTVISHYIKFARRSSIDKAQTAKKCWAADNCFQFAWNLFVVNREITAKKSMI